MFIKKIFQLIHKSRHKSLSSVWNTWLWHQYCGFPHEEDIYLFSNLNGVSGMVLDLGANAAVFSSSLFQVNQSLRVQSWEPNKKMRPFLRATKVLHPLRFSYRMLGAGVKSEQIDLHIPVAPDKDMTPSGSLDPEEFEKDYVQERLLEESGENEGYSFIKQKVKVARVDDFNLQPVAVKIDVEGFELQALQGMQATLERCSPLLMIEDNNADRWFGFLKDLGYILYSYHHNEQQLRVIEEHCPTLNVIGLHLNTPVQVRERLLPLLAK